MSKILDATCDATGKVTADNVVVPGVTVLSEGKQASTGLLFLEQDKKKYMPSSATDIKTTIEKLVSLSTDISNALTTIGLTLTAIGANMTGSTTAPPPTLATNVDDINSKIATLNSTITQLDTLKDALK